MIARALNWYWLGLKTLPAFSLGYIIGGIVVGTLMNAPALAHAVLAMVP